MLTLTLKLFSPPLTWFGYRWAPSVFFHVVRSSFVNTNSVHYFFVVSKNNSFLVKFVCTILKGQFLICLKKAIVFS